MHSELDNQHKDYAATDAYACILIYDYLRSHAKVSLREANRAEQGTPSISGADDTDAKVRKRIEELHNRMSGMHLSFALSNYYC